MWTTVRVLQRRSQCFPPSKRTLITSHPIDRPPVLRPQLAMPYHLIDIGANLTDSMYQGVYGGKHYHQPDLDTVLQRAWDGGVQRIIITAGNLEDAHHALQLAQTDGNAAPPSSKPPQHMTPFHRAPVLHCGLPSNALWGV